MFDIPIVLFLFKRSITIHRIIDRISMVKPTKLYLLSDEGRDDEERKRVAEVRRIVEESIYWPCEIIKNYAETNRGVHGNIGMGARWVFQREEQAIFLEDDNLPDVTFFYYCEKLLEKFANNKKVLWICGTNYLGEYRNKNEDSYMFTKNLLPCGWASWSNKFLKYYDYDFHTLFSEDDVKQIKKDYRMLALYKQEKNSILNEYKRKKNNKQYSSWDFHMIYSIHYYDMYGVAPATNLIENIGVDEDSEHGGNNPDNVMTKRFCGIATTPIEMDLRGPEKVTVDPVFEDRIGRIILYPFSMRMSGMLAKCIRKIVLIPTGIRTKDYFINIVRRNNNEAKKNCKH